MKTCKTCKHWNQKDGFTEGGIMVGQCDHPMVFRPTYGPTRNTQRHGDKMKPDRVWTADEGGATGELFTGPDFGCIHHQPEIEE